MTPKYDLKPGEATQNTLQPSVFLKDRHQDKEGQLRGGSEGGTGFLPLRLLLCPQSSATGGPPPLEDPGTVPSLRLIGFSHLALPASCSDWYMCMKFKCTSSRLSVQTVCAPWIMCTDSPTSL